MNLFQDLFFTLILILFPILIYLIFISTLNIIDKNTKKLILDASLVSALYLVNLYNPSFQSFLILNSIVIIGYLKRRLLISNIIAFLIVLLYLNNYNMIMIMFVPYLLLYILYKVKEKRNINEFIFMDTFLIIYYVILIIWISIFNNNLYNSFSFSKIIYILIFNYIIIHVVYIVYIMGEKIIKDNIRYNEIKKDSKMKMSLFKITHEIKNPISVIKAYLDMLDTSDRNQVEKYIPIIKKEIKRLLNLLQDFLLVNKANVKFDIMDINMLLEDVIDQERSMLKKENIKLESKLLDDEIYINGDYNRLSQVIINIIKNSKEAINKNEKGKIIVKSKVVDNDVIIIVKDNGVGISKKHLEKIKEPFYTTKTRGTGLGVSISQEIIKAHNGKIIYESEENVGTKVTIKIPLFRKEEYDK